MNYELDTVKNEIMRTFKIDDVSDVYSKAELKKAVFKAQGKISEGRMFGEFATETLSTTVDLTAISHRITKMEMIDDSVYCDVEVLRTLRGNLLREYSKTHDDLRLVMRKVMKLNSVRQVNELFIITADIEPAVNVAV